jgi:hypothetical protein
MSGRCQENLMLKYLFAATVACALVTGPAAPSFAQTATETTDQKPAK